MTYLTESDKRAHRLLKSQRATKAFAADTPSKQADHRTFPLSPIQRRQVQDNYRGTGKPQG